MSADVSIGPHMFRFEPPNLVFLSFSDEIDERHAAQVIDACAGSSEQRPFAIVCRTPGMKNVSPKARKVFADGFKGMPVVAAGFVDASIRTRAIVTFVVTAINVFRERKMGFGFFDSEEDARRWAGEQLRGWSS
jgi:hypothetical protein